MKLRSTLSKQSMISASILFLVGIVFIVFCCASGVSPEDLNETKGKSESIQDEMLSGSQEQKEEGAIMIDIVRYRRASESWQKEYDVLAPKVGDVAPDFQLHDVNGENPVRLSDFQGQKPVALIFGSYT